MRLLFPSSVIVKRELLTALRRRRSVLYLLLTVVPCMMLATSFWPRQGLDVMQGQAQAATMTQQFLGLYALTLLGVCALLTPAFAAASISYERDMDTLDLVRTTMISRTGLILAKLLSASGLFLLVAFASAPAAASLFFASGLDWVQLLSIGTTILLATLTWALVGLACASRMRNFVIALALTYALIFLLSGLPEVVLMTVLNRWRRGWLEYVTSMAYKQAPFWLFPPVVIVGLVTDQFSWDRYGVFLSGQAAVAFVASLCALRSIGREREDRKRRLEKPIDDAAILASRRRRFPYYLLDPLRRNEAIGDHANPMRVKELRWGLLGMQTRMIRAMYATMAAFMLLGVVGYGPDGVYMWFSLAIGFFALAGPPFLLPAFSRDLHRETLDALRGTLLWPDQIILGKFAAGLATLLPPAVGILAASAILLGANLFFGERAWNFLSGYVTLAVCIAVVVAVCLLVAQFARRTAPAFVMAYLVIFALFAGVWFGGLYGVKWTLLAVSRPELDRQSRSHPMSFAYYERLEWHAQAWPFLSPLGAYAGITGHTRYVELPPERPVHAFPYIADRRIQFRSSPSYGYEWQLPHPFLMWSFSMTGYIVLACVLVRLSIWRYARVGVRDP